MWKKDDRKEEIKERDGIQVTRTEVLNYEQTRSRTQCEDNPGIVLTLSIKLGTPLPWPVAAMLICGYSLLVKFSNHIAAELPVDGSGSDESDAALWYS